MVMLLWISMGSSGIWMGVASKLKFKYKVTQLCMRRIYVEKYKQRVMHKLCKYIAWGIYLHLCNRYIGIIIVRVYVYLCLTFREPAHWTDDGAEYGCLLSKLYIYIHIQPLYEYWYAVYFKDNNVDYIYVFVANRIDLLLFLLQGGYTDW